MLLLNNNYSLLLNNTASEEHQIIYDSRSYDLLLKGFLYQRIKMIWIHARFGIFAAEYNKNKYNFF